MTNAEYRDEVLETLASAKRRDRNELEQQLEQAGPECPFDSIYLVRVGIRVARRHGIDLKAKKAIEYAFKSVDALSDLLAILDGQKRAA